jgi:hypothetical protein
MKREEVIEHLNEHYSTLCVDEARHFVNKHYGETNETIEEIANDIANKENLMERITNE